MKNCKCKNDINLKDEGAFVKDTVYTYDYDYINIGEEIENIKKLYMVFNIDGKKLYCDENYFNNNFIII